LLGGALGNASSAVVDEAGGADAFTLVVLVHVGLAAGRVTPLVTTVALVDTLGIVAVALEVLVLGADALAGGVLGSTWWTTLGLLEDEPSTGALVDTLGGRTSTLELLLTVFAYALTFVVLVGTGRAAPALAEGMAVGAGRFALVRVVGLLLLTGWALALAVLLHLARGAADGVLADPAAGAGSAADTVGLVGWALEDRGADLTVSFTTDRPTAFAVLVGLASGAATAVGRAGSGRAVGLAAGAVGSLGQGATRVASALAGGLGVGRVFVCLSIGVDLGEVSRVTRLLRYHSQRFGVDPRPPCSPRCWSKSRQGHPGRDNQS
jgi:hypothetical protein